MPGVPDVNFSGVANVANNSTAYLDEEGAYSEDGTCTGVTLEKGTIVRAADAAGASALCADAGLTVSDPPRLIDYGYAVPSDAWACVNQVVEPDVIQFNSPSSVAVTMFGGTVEEPTETTVNFNGNSTGTWTKNDTGDFVMNLTVDDGTFDANSPIGLVTVGYSAVQVGTSVGAFDPATGEGGFSLAVDMNLNTLNGSPMPQPCAISTSFDLEGSIDLATGTATVSQENFEMTPPGDADCGGLGALIGPMLVDGTNQGVMTFQVFQP